MKKFGLLAFAPFFLAVLCSFSFSSCSSDDDDDNPNTNFVYGTKWYTTDLVTMWESLYGKGAGPSYIVLHFDQQASAEMYFLQGDVIVTSFSRVNYTCQGNRVMISAEGKTAIYEVKGREMKKVNNEGMRYTTFTRQD